MRRWWSLRTAGFLAAGAVAGLSGWALGPRAALALTIGFGAAGGLLVLTWLRSRILSMNAEVARLRSAQQELRSALDRRLPELQKRLRADLSAVEERLLDAHGVTEKRVRDEVKQVRAEVSTAEKRLRTAASGDLVALEKRLRAVPPQPGVR